MTRQLSVLVVEDEPLISMMLEDFLDCLGHRCAAATGLLKDAMALAEAGDFDVAIVDLNLAGGLSAEPVMDILERTGKPFLVASGDLGYTGRAAPMLNKPYHMGNLERGLEVLVPAVVAPEAA